MIDQCDPTLAGAGFTQLTATGPLLVAQLTFQVTLPAPPSTFVISQALPLGALISVTSGGTTEDVTVSSSGVVSPGIGTITLTSGLVNHYTSAPEIASLEFDLIVTGATTETWPQLSMNPIHPSYWQTVVNSQLITLSLPPAPPSPTPENPNPAPGNYSLAGGYNDVHVNDLTDPTNGINSNPNLYLNLLVPLQNVDIVAIPGNTNANVQPEEKNMPKSSRYRWSRSSF